MLDMVGRIAHSESYKTKMSVLEFLQIAVFSNFPALVHGAGYRPQVVTLVKSLLQVRAGSRYTQCMQVFLIHLSVSLCRGFSGEHNIFVKPEIRLKPFPVKTTFF